MKYLCLLMAAGGLSACANLPEQEGGGIQAEPKEYVTGSMLPQRRSDTKNAKLTKEQVEEFQRNGNSALGTLPTGK